jgi:hypothetical protein
MGTPRLKMSNPFLLCAFIGDMGHTAWYHAGYSREPEPARSRRRKKSSCAPPFLGLCLRVML